LHFGLRDFNLKTAGFHAAFFCEIKLDAVKVGEHEKISSD